MEDPSAGATRLHATATPASSGDGPRTDKGEKVGAVVCFVIASTHRGRGVASQLLNTACNKFSEKGFEFAEAYPVKNPKSDAYNFPGPLSMYLKNGFTTYRDADW